MASTMKAAIHLGPTYIENLEVFKNANFEEIRSLFSITQMLTWDRQDDFPKCEFY